MSARSVTFEGGVRTLLAFVVAFPVVLLGIALPVQASAFVSSLPAWATATLQDAHFLGLALLGVVVLRYEGVRVADLGLSVRHLLSGLIAFGAVWTALNALGVGLAVAAGEAWGPATLRAAWPDPAVLVPLLVFAGLVEEFTVRGYLQTKLVALRGEGRTDVALAIGGASLFFALAHVPGFLVGGAGPGTIVFGVALLTLSGAAFGVLYEFTHNLYFVALLHALGNSWILLADWRTWSGWPVLAFFAGLAVVYLGATLAYRSRTLGTDLTPAVERRSTARHSSGRRGEGQGPDRLAAQTSNAPGDSSSAPSRTES